MKIEVDKEMLLRGISIADSIISSRTLSTILANCLFIVSEYNIEIISTDNEIGIKTRVPAKSDTAGSFTVNGKKLISILKEMPKGDVILEVDNSFLVHVMSKGVKGNYKLFGTSRGDFPDVPGFDDDKSIEVDQQMFKDVIRKVIYAAATDLIKPAFNGVYFISEEYGKLSAVATDSKRLALYTFPINVEMKIEEGTIIPLKTIHEISRLLTSTGNCRFYIGQTQCFFRIGDTMIVSRVVDGQFPNYKQVIPKEHKMNAVVDTGKLVESLRRVMIFTREPSYKVILKFSNDKLKIEARTQDIGEAEEELSISLHCEEEIIIGISGQYLFDAVKEIDSDHVVLGITSQISPVVVRPEGDDMHLSVIMPIQIRSDSNE